MSKPKAVYGILGTILFLAACSEPPKPPVSQEAEKPPEPIEGQKAFFQMYVAARAWASDVQALTLESLRIPEVKPEGAKFGAWRATFVSPSRQRAISFTYSVVESYGNLHKGVFRGHEEGYSPGELTQPWPVSAFKISSEKALAAALKQRQTQAYVKKHPNVPITFILEKTRRHPNVVWRVVWGESVSTSDYSVFIDASTGDFLEVMR